jgi:oligopeptide transport system ATP-binding protein
MSAPLLQVKDLSKHFPIGRKGLWGKPEQMLRAVDGVSFDLERGETLGLVGESGCGKSTCARTIIGLQPATGGSVRFDGVELTALSRREWSPYRRRIQMIFQDPYASLDPRQTVGSILTEPLAIHRLHKPRERRLRAMQLLDTVSLDPRHIYRYPHEFSGGQRQRIGIARALALEPELIICDEPVSALDVSIQAQVINLLGELQERFGLAYLFIAHDLAVVRHICRNIAVMYLGRLVEVAGRDDLFERPQHPYTRALLSAIPHPDPEHERTRERIVLEGDVPSPLDPPSGCSFHPRCPERGGVEGERCSREVPELVALENGRTRACHLETNGCTPAATSH